MTKELRATLAIIAKHLTRSTRILEIGSRAAKGQEELANLRGLFTTQEYVGLDMEPGSGVDVVSNADKLPFPDSSFDLVLCLETLEHARDPWRLVKEAERVVKKNGVIILSSQQNFPIHMHPSDYFRYTPYGLGSLVTTLSQAVVFGISPPFDDEVKLNPKHVVGVFWQGKTLDAQKLQTDLTTNEKLISGHKPYRHRLIDFAKIFRRALSELKYHQTIEFFPLQRGK